MSASAIIAIAVIVVVLLAAVLFVTNVRRRDTRRGAGVAVARDEGGRPQHDVRPPEAARPARPTSRPPPRRAEPLDRARARRRPRCPAPYVPPDPEQLGVTRRQFFNRSSVTFMSVSLGGFGAACIAFLWPKLGGGFGSKITVGKVDDVLADDPGQRQLLLPGRGPDVAHGVPGRRPPEGREGLPAAGARRHGGRHRRALPEVPAPRLPRAVLRHLAVVRVPVPRLAVQPGR